MANVLAIADEQVTLEFLAEVTRLGPELVKHIVERLTRDGRSTGGHRLRPPVRSSVLAALSFDEHSRLELAVATALYHRGESDAVVAAHLRGARSPEGADVPWAATVLERMADQALDEDNVSLAVELLRKAHSFRTVAGARAALQVRLADVEWLHKPESALRHLTELLEHARLGRIGPDGLMTVVKLLLWHGRRPEAVELLDLVPDTAADSGPADVGVRFHLLWAAIQYPGLLSGTRHVVPSVPPAAPLLGRADRSVRVARTLFDSMTPGAHPTAVADAHQLLETVHPLGGKGVGLGIALLATEALVHQNDLERAEVWARRFLKAGDPIGSVTLAAMLDASAAMIAERQGNLPLALDRASRSYRALSATGWGVAAGAPISVLVAVHTEIGDLSAAAYYLAQPVPDAMFQTRFGLHYLSARGRYLLATDRPEAALADFLFCGELMRTWQVDVPGLEPWRLGAARAMIAKGETGAARRMILDQMTRLGTTDPRTRAAALRQLAAVSPLSSRRQILHEAIQLLEDSGDRLQYAYALADLSRAELELHERRRHWVLNRKAAQAAQECGAVRLYESLRNVNCPSNGWHAATPLAALDRLSSVERRVARLASEGYTNPEISQRLFVTRSTVEQHLTRIYRKLGIRRRADLPMEF